MSTHAIDESEPETSPGREITLTVNGRRRRLSITDGQLLVEVVREGCGLTGTHLGCANGDCGACTVRVDGAIVKSCVVLAASVDGAEVTTIEGIGPGDGTLSTLQQALWENDAFQCGFCLPGHLFALGDLLEQESHPSEQDVRDALVGNLCRCTGYVNLVRGALDAAERLRGSSVPEPAGAGSQVSSDTPAAAIRPWQLHH
jgi:aerobic-type carbon monoxide dehydrogenase small subunit (CoxS/CutS family)